MASYAVRLFKNTGYNAVNVPDNPDTLYALNSTSVVDVPNVSILQNYFLTSVRVAATWEQVQDVDYASIGDFYYTVDGVTMLSQSTAELSLTPDFWTSAGGVSMASGTPAVGFDILDGITDRATVLTTQDTFGAYTDADPLTAPQRPLVIDSEWMGDTRSTDGETVFLSSTLDLVKQAEQTEGVTYTDSETGETVTVPRTYQISDSDQTSIGLGQDSSGTNVTVKDGTKYYIMTSGSTAATGVAKARSLGIESAIIDQWAVDPKFVSVTYSGTTGEVTGVSAVKSTTASSLSFLYSTTVKNERALYGEYNKYGIITCAGNSLEAKPEEIISSSQSEAAPSITRYADPRPSGCPYYRFEYINGSSTDFWRNAVAGSTWHKVPLVYQGQSGSALTRLNFENSRKVAENLADQFYNDNSIAQFRSAVDLGSNIASAVSGANTYGLTLAAGGPVSGATAAGIVGQAVTGVVNAGINYEFNRAALENKRDYYKTNYATEKANELSQLYQATTVYTPTVSFPYNASIMRDLKGNGALLYRYRYDDTDLSRVDKLLTMYGYKESEALTPANFYRRPKFDYVQCSSVTVSGLPLWWCKGLSDQLRNGIRIWHVKPASTVYTEGNVTASEG